MRKPHGSSNNRTRCLVRCGLDRRQDHHLFPGRRSGFAGGTPRERCRIGGVHVGGGRGELGGAGIDALEDGAHSERNSFLLDRVVRNSGELGKASIRKAHGLEATQRAGAGRQTLGLDIRLRLDDAADLGQKPGIDLAGGMDVLVREAEAHRLGHFEQTVRRWRAECGTDRALVVALAETFDRDLVEACQAGFERP